MDNPESLIFEGEIPPPHLTTPSPAGLGTLLGWSSAPNLPLSAVDTGSLQSTGLSS